MDLDFHRGECLLPCVYLVELEDAAVKSGHSGLEVRCARAEKPGYNGDAGDEGLQPYIS